MRLIKFKCSSSLSPHFHILMLGSAWCLTLEINMTIMYELKCETFFEKESTQFPTIKYQMTYHIFPLVQGMVADRCWYPTPFSPIAGLLTFPFPQISRRMWGVISYCFWSTPSTYCHTYKYIHSPIATWMKQCTLQYRLLEINRFLFILKDR